MRITPSVRPTALLVSGDPAVHHEACAALDRRGVRMRFALDDVQVTLGLAEQPSLVLVDLTHRARLSERTVDRINRLRGSAFVLALHEGRIEDASSLYANLNVDAYCHAGAACAGPIAAALPGTHGTVH